MLESKTKSKTKLYCRGPAPCQGPALDLPPEIKFGKDALNKIIVRVRVVKKMIFKENHKIIRNMC